MAAWRRAIELSLGDEDTAKLRSIAQSRTEPASRVERARILLAYREDPSFFAVARALGLHHQTVQRCVERAVAEGPIAALDDRPRPGREPTITPEAKAWLVCRWRAGRRRNWAIRTNFLDDAASGLPCPRAAAFWPAMPASRWLRPAPASMDRRRDMWCLANVVQGTVCKILQPGRSEAAQSAILPGTPATRSLRKRWPRCCASIAK